MHGVAKAPICIAVASGLATNTISPMLPFTDRQCCPWNAATQGKQPCALTLEGIRRAVASATSV
eukprot:scaffold287927_cov35-Tisochrysis_lutea.AAC.2